MDKSSNMKYFNEEIKLTLFFGIAKKAMTTGMMEVHQTNSQG